MGRRWGGVINHNTKLLSNNNETWIRLRKNDFVYSTNFLTVYMYLKNSIIYSPRSCSVPQTKFKQLLLNHTSQNQLAMSGVAYKVYIYCVKARLVQTGIYILMTYGIPSHVAWFEPNKWMIYNELNWDIVERLTTSGDSLQKKHTALSQPYLFLIACTLS